MKRLSTLPVEIIVFGIVFNLLFIIVFCGYGLFLYDKYPKVFVTKGKIICKFFLFEKNINFNDISYFRYVDGSDNSLYLELDSINWFTLRIISQLNNRPGKRGIIISGDAKLIHNVMSEY